MATQTDHMKLTKPAYTDSADIAVINSNMDAIDTATSKILPVISGTTNNSGYTIASGEYFEANGKLCKANASIPTNQAWSSSATEQSDHGAINALNGNLAKLDSGSNVTNDILASALTVTRSTFFYGSGSNYSGTVPSTNMRYGVFHVDARSSRKFVTAIGTGGEVAVNAYDGTSWAGWQALASKSELVKYKDITINDIAYSAGTIGTRGAQKAESGVLTNAQKFISATCIFVSNSSSMLPFLDFESNNLYINVYRTITSAFSGGSITVRVAYTD